MIVIFYFWQAIKIHKNTLNILNLEKCIAECWYCTNGLYFQGNNKKKKEKSKKI